MHRLCVLFLSFCCLLVTAAAQTPAAREISIAGASGLRVTIENEGGSGEDPGGRLLESASHYEQQLGAATGQIAQPVVRRGSGGTFAFITRVFSNDTGHLHAFVTSEQSSAICHVEAPLRGTDKNALSAAIAGCNQEFKHPSQSSVAREQTPPSNGHAWPSASKSAPATSAKSQPPPLGGANPPSHPENWNAVAGVYFSVTYITGAGGMPLPDYEPWILFRDGTYYRIDEAALEDVDLAAEKQRRPKHWGKWRQQGPDYFLTDERGRTEKHQISDGSFFKAFDAASAGSKLTGRYKRVSGGGNTALGGEVMVAVSSNLSFTPNGQFTGGTSVGAMNSGAQSGVGSTVSSNRRMPGPGSYELDRYTLTMRYPDGRIERKFFAFGSQKTPPRVDTDMIFIGSRTFVND